MKDVFRWAFKEVEKISESEKLGWVILSSILGIGKMKALPPKVVQQWMESHNVTKGRTHERSSSIFFVLRRAHTVTVPDRWQPTFAFKTMLEEDIAWSLDSSQHWTMLNFFFFLTISSHRELFLKLNLSPVFLAQRWFL